MEIRKNFGLYFGLSILLFASYMFWQAFNYKFYTNFGPGPGLMPRWLYGGLIVLSLIFIYQALKKDVVLFSEAFPKGKELRAVISFPATLIVFLLIVSFTGFVIAGTVMVYLLLMKDYKWYIALGISAASSLFFFFAFQTLLKVPLPVNALGF
ncbi:MAG: tripartite tricarboxylate transporter family receptor [Clostridiales bacterium]|nr:tripartite tricarboxylate transporter family receptor [Clostridiales bacterium]